MIKTLHLNGNWVTFTAAIEERFTDRQEISKDYEKPLVLKYASDRQTYLTLFKELYSRVQLS